MNKIIYKYSTEAEIPEGAIYLSTQIEKTVDIRRNDNGSIERRIEKNEDVWHYFLVEVKD